MAGKISFQNGLITGLLSLVFTSFLSACSTVNTSGNNTEVGSGVRVASQPHYTTGTARTYTVKGITYTPHIPEAGHEEVGIASWYGAESPSRTTADGEPFDTNLITAAHKTFPLPSIAEVTNLDNGRTIRLRVNDRGPFVANRIMDLSKGAAKALGVYAAGTARVKITWLGPAEAIAGTGITAKTSDSLPDSGDLYIVQLGAYGLQENAENALAQIDNARIERKGGLFVVYLGPFSGPAAAEPHRQAAIASGFHDAIVKRSE